MSKFFDDLLFHEGFVYTLWGHKPLTLAAIYHGPESVGENMDTQNCYIEQAYDIPENWEKWEKICARFPMKRYLLFQLPCQEDPNFFYLYFVDILQTATIL